MSKQIIILISLFIVIFMFFFFNQGSAQKDKDKMSDLIKNGAFLVDVRTEWEFAEGSAPGAVNIPLDKISQNLNKFKDKPSIIVFCRSGNRSSQAKTILEKNGIQEVYNGGTWNDVAELVIKAKNK